MSMHKTGLNYRKCVDLVYSIVHHVAHKQLQYSVHPTNLGQMPQ